ncbi:S1C family serine protease [Flindersiella endophytica]
MRLTTPHLVIGAVLLALLAGTAGGLIGSMVDSGSSSPATSGSSQTVAACDVSKVAASVFPSLVTISVRGASGVAGSGSGSVLDKDGNILTNDHVIEAAATGGTITVDFARGAAQVRADIVGRDPATDLAVIRARGGSGSYRPISLGDSAALNVGQPVVAAGSPLGLNGTITSGIVSALGRYINVGKGDQPATLINAVQTDAAVNPGNSGGPLTDCAGHQIGVNTAGAQLPDAEGGSIGLNFAIPISFAHSVAEELIRSGRATHPVIGVLSVTVTDEIASATGLPRGALIEQVIPGLGAAEAGLRVGDVITRVGDEPVNSVDQLLVALRSHAPGDRVQVTFNRGSARRTADVPVTEAA